MSIFIEVPDLCFVLVPSGSGFSAYSLSMVLLFVIVVAVLHMPLIYYYIPCEWPRTRILSPFERFQCVSVPAFITSLDAVAVPRTNDRIESVMRVNI